MKSFVSVTFSAAILVLLGCGGNVQNQAAAPIDGSGNVTTEPRTVSGMNIVVVSGAGRIEIEQSATESLTIAADDNILPHLTSDVRDGKLFLGVREGTTVNPTREIVYSVKLKELKGIELAGSAQIEARGVDTAQLKCRVSGSGKITAAGKATDQNIEIAGAGNFTGSALPGKSATVNITGNGSALVAASDELKANITGAGKVEYVGDPRVQQNVTGSGSVRKQ